MLHLQRRPARPADAQPDAARASCDVAPSHSRRASHRGKDFFDLKNTTYLGAVSHENESWGLAAGDIDVSTDGGMLIQQMAHESALPAVDATRGVQAPRKPAAWWVRDQFVIKMASRDRLRADLQEDFVTGAEGGIRTPTVLQPPAPQAGASASSATSAF
jgi:hypothetical protein